MFSQPEGGIDKSAAEEKITIPEEPIVEEEMDKRGFSLDTRGDAALSSSTTQAATDDEPFKNDEQPKAPEPIEVKEKKASSEINIESLVKDNKYTPNPILDDTSAIEDFVYRNADNEKAGFNKSEPSKSIEPDPENEIDLSFVSNFKSEPVEDKKETNKLENKINTDASQGEKKNQFKGQQNDNKKQFKGGNKNKKDDFVNFSKLKENDASGLLGGIYQDYLETSDSNQKKLTLFLERVASVLSNYEQITGHLEDSTAKMIQINDKVVDQAKDIQQLKNATQTATGSSLQEQIDDVRYDIDSLEKEFRSLKTETRRKQNETAEQLAALGADAYKSGGIMQKMELLKVDIINIQKKIGEVMGAIPESNVPKPESIKNDEKVSQMIVSDDYSNNQRNRPNRFDRRLRGQDARKNYPRQGPNTQNDDYSKQDQSQEPPTKTSNLDLRGIL